MPFWSGTNTMTYGGHDGTTDVDPYQFGVGDVTGIGSITLNAQVVNVGADLLLHMVYHKDKPGFYFTIRAPLGAMSTTAIVSENVDQKLKAFITSVCTAIIIIDFLVFLFNHFQLMYKCNRYL